VPGRLERRPPSSTKPEYAFVEVFQFRHKRFVSANVDVMNGLSGHDDLRLAEKRSWNVATLNV
jgi:hypothetical protein